MAKAQANQSGLRTKPKIKRKGVHSKKKNSSSPSSKNYRKKYKGQGR